MQRMPINPRRSSVFCRRSWFTAIHPNVAVHGTWLGIIRAGLKRWRVGKQGNPDASGTANTP